MGDGNLLNQPLTANRSLKPRFRFGSLLSEHQQIAGRRGLLTPVWLPDEIQANFGEVNFRFRHMVTSGNCPTATFPHFKVGLTQVFWGQQ